MLKRIYFGVCMFLTVSTVAHAQDFLTCPNPETVRHLQFDSKSWQAFTLDNGTPIALKDLPSLVTHVADNKLAEYMQNTIDGPSHCYYGDSDLTWSPFYLSSTIELLPHGNNWHYLSNAIWQCEEHMGEHCEWQYVAE